MTAQRIERRSLFSRRAKVLPALAWLMLRSALLQALLTLYGQRMHTSLAMKAFGFIDSGTACQREEFSTPPCLSRREKASFHLYISGMPIHAHDP